jgi:hypothetical protein
MQRATGEKQQNGTATGIFELQCSSSAPAEEGRCNATNAPRSVHTARNNPTLRPKKLDHSPAPQPVSVSAQNTTHDKGALTKHHQPGFRIVTTGLGLKNAHVLRKNNNYKSPGCFVLFARMLVWS